MASSNGSLNLSKPAYRRQPFIVETIRAYMEEILKTRTRRVKLSLLVPWDPNRYNWTCHPNPFSMQWSNEQAGILEANDPLDSCIKMDSKDRIRIVKADTSLPYACPGTAPFRGIGDFTAKSILYVYNREDCGSWEWSPHLYDSYIVDAYLKGDNPLEIIVEWCPLGLVDQSDLEERMIYAVKLTKHFHSLGRGVKLTILPGYALGSRWMDPLYWSSGASYHSDLERASKVSDRITWQVYIVGKRPFYNDLKAIRIPFLYGGWIHTYRTGIPQSVVSPGTRFEKVTGSLTPTNTGGIIGKLLDDLLDEGLPLEARELLFHFNLFIEKQCIDALRFILPSMLKPVYAPQTGSGLEFLPEIRFYLSNSCNYYNLESGRKIYPCNRRLRYESLVRYMNKLKEKIVEAEESFCS